MFGDTNGDHRTLSAAQRMINDGDPQSAVALCQKWLRAPGAGRNAKLLAVYASALSGVGQSGEGRRLLKKAMRLEPRSVELHCRYGNTYVDQSRFDEAKPHFAKALALHPGHSWAMRCMAETLMQLGDNRGAMEILEPAVQGDRIDPDAGVALCRVYPRLDRCDDALRLIGRLLEHVGLPAPVRTSLLYARGESLHRLGRFDEAFAAYEEANRAVGVHHDRVAHADEIDRLIKAWTPEAIAALARPTRKSERFVFIVGMPRSGTSLVEQIVASHGRVFGAGELRHIGDIVSQFRGDAGGVAGALTDLSRLTPANLNNAAGHYHEQIRALSPGADRVTDKMPNNFLALGLISVLFPDCRIIHCVRDPRDTCLSCYFNHFQGLRNTFAYGLEDLGSYFTDYWRLMNHWKATLETPILDAVYEDIVDDLEGQSRRLIEFLELEWDERCLEFHKTKRTTKTLSADQVNRPIYRSSKARWMAYERHLGPLLAALPSSALCPPPGESGES